MLGRGGVGPFALAVAGALGACSGGADRATLADPTVPEATTTTVTSTVPAFDPQALLPHPLADAADFDAVVRELFAIRDNAFRFLDVERLEAVYDASCRCIAEADEIRRAIESRYRILGDEVEIVSVEVESKILNRGAFLLLTTDQPAIRHLGPNGRLRTARRALDDFPLRVAVGHDGARWVVLNIEPLEEV